MAVVDLGADVLVAGGGMAGVCGAVAAAHREITSWEYGY